MPRPRKPDALTASQRAAASRARLVASGGAKRSYALSAATLDALAAIRAASPGETELAIVERAILAEARRAKRRGAE